MPRRAIAELTGALEPVTEPKRHTGHHLPAAHSARRQAPPPFPTVRVWAHLSCTGAKTRSSRPICCQPQAFGRHPNTVAAGL